MTGLVWVDRLHMSIVQQAGLALAMWCALSGHVSGRKIVCIHMIMLTIFWNCPLSTDTTLLFQSAGSLQRFTWRQFLSEFAFKNYVKLQPPFYSYFVSRLPVLWTHQIIMSAWAMLCSALMLRMYGQRASYLLATPVYLLMSTQPSNDLVLVGLVLIVLRLQQLGYRSLAALLYGFAYPIKPLALLTLPVMGPVLGVPVFGGLAIWGLYILWSTQYYFGIMQWSFLLHQLGLR